MTPAEPTNTVGRVCSLCMRKGSLHWWRELFFFLLQQSDLQNNPRRLKDLKEGVKEKQFPPLTQRVLHHM